MFLTFGVFLLGSLPALYISIEKAKVKKERESVNAKALENYHSFRKSWEAKSEISDLDSFFSPPVSEKDNFYAHPAYVAELNKIHSPPLSAIHRDDIQGLNCNDDVFFATQDAHNDTKGYPSRISEWLDPPQPGLPEKSAAQQCLKHIAIYDQRLNAISEASKMPESNNSLHNRASSSNINIHCSSLLARRAILRMAIGDTKQAQEDVQAMLRLASHTSKYHTFIGLTHTIFSYFDIEKTVWEGLSRHAFSDDELSKIDEKLSTVDLNALALDAIRCEVTVFFANTELLKNTPKYMEPPFMSLESIDLKEPNTWDDFFDKPEHPGGFWIEHNLKHMKALVGIMLYPNGQRARTILKPQVDQIRNPEKARLLDYSAALTTYVKAAINRQAHINNMRTAIAIERFRLKNQSYPDNLRQLSPAYLPEIPIDIITGKPVRYRIDNNNSPVVSSTAFDLFQESDPVAEIHWSYSPMP
ncbi:hypothetical protein [Oceaniferula marina]|nr:hypothetical protein [Oceaniferula marina]